MTKLIVAIDPGVNTGVALWDYQNQKFISISTMKIHYAMNLLLRLKASATEYGETSLDLVIFEDARKRTGGFRKGAEQGAGSIKRDCSIWEDFLRDNKIDFLKSVPHNTKLKEEVFRKITGWTGKTSSHSRDAAMIVFGMTSAKVEFKLKVKKERREALDTVRFDLKKLSKKYKAEHGN